MAFDWKAIFIKKDFRIRTAFVFMPSAFAFAGVTMSHMFFLHAVAFACKTLKKSLNSIELYHFIAPTIAAGEPIGTTPAFNGVAEVFRNASKR